MYIRKTTRTYKGKTYTNYLLVESHLTPRGPRQKVICSLGDLAPRPQEQWLALARKLEGALTGQQELSANRTADAELVPWWPRSRTLPGADLENGPHQGSRSAQRPAKRQSPSTLIG